MGSSQSGTELVVVDELAIVISNYIAFQYYIFSSAKHLSLLQRVKG
jgi:hypothetical protein